MGVRLNRSDLAAHFGVSLPTIDTWRREGMPVARAGSKGVEWSFDLADCIKWYADRRVTQAMGDGPTDLDEIEKRTAQAKMLVAELDLAKKRGEVAAVRDFERAQARAFAEIRANVMNVPQRVVVQLLGETNEITFKQLLRKELTQALEAAANADLTLSEDEGTQDESDSV